MAFCDLPWPLSSNLRSDGFRTAVAPFDLRFPRIRQWYPAAAGGGAASSAGAVSPDTVGSFRLKGCEAWMRVAGTRWIDVARELLLSERRGVCGDEEVEALACGDGEGRGDAVGGPSVALIGEGGGDAGGGAAPLARLTKEGNDMFERGEFAAAEAQYRRVLDRSPQGGDGIVTVVCHTNLATCILRQSMEGGDPGRSGGGVSPRQLEAFTHYVDADEQCAVLVEAPDVPEAVREKAAARRRMLESRLAENAKHELHRWMCSRRPAKRPREPSSSSTARREVTGRAGESESEDTP